MVITIISLPILMFIIRIRFIIGPTLVGLCGQAMSVIAQTVPERGRTSKTPGIRRVPSHGACRRRRSRGNASDLWHPPADATLAELHWNS